MKAQDDFIDQMTRKRLVEWCSSCLNSPLGNFTPASQELVYVRYAILKKWVSEVKDSVTTYKVLSAGWDTAARFLKR